MGFSLILLVRWKDSAVDKLSRSMSGCRTGIVGRVLVSVTTGSSLRNKDS